MHDANPDTCEQPGCDDGWIMDSDDLYAPCPRCEADDATMQADHDAEIDALYEARRDELRDAGCDPQLASWIAEREHDRDAIPW